MSLIAFILALNSNASLAQDPYAPPELKQLPACVCPSPQERPDVMFSGYVIDAEVTLGSDRRSVEDRMATIFDVKWSDDGELEGRTRLWHATSAEADRCLMRAAE
jgi:hypothetical protein